MQETYIDRLPTVSLITISQYSRAQSMALLLEFVNQQTYSNIVEWIIVEGSPSKEFASKNQHYIDLLVSQTSVPIKYLEYVANAKLGGLRNRGNDHASGEIIVCMDDDDYYPPLRVSHAVERLLASECLIAGCNKMYIYDFHIDKMMQYPGLVRNDGSMVEHHAANNSFAYKAEYLNNHRYNDETCIGEEAHFTNEFTAPMIQLDSDKSVICSSHGENTYAKRLHFTYASSRDELLDKQEVIDSLLPIEYRERYKPIFCRPEDSPYDIVYYAGGFTIPWDPRSESLGGSEQAIVNLATQWQQLGKKVAVYLTRESNNYVEIHKEPLIHNGVEYFDWRVFDFSKTYQTLILWRTYGLKNFLGLQPVAKQIYLDLHDGAFNEEFLKEFNARKMQINKIFVKSQFHKNELIKSVGDGYASDDIYIIPNGVAVSKFLPKANVAREKYRFCYTSCYSRGLVNLLSYTWPLIYHHEPRAELHIYYGMDYLHPVLKSMIQVLLAQPGVMDHGRRSMDIVSHEKARANFHLYVTDVIAETDCISVKESLVAGAIPIISTVGVFAERAGYHYAIDTSTNQATQQSYQALASYCLELLSKEDEELEAKRIELAKSETILTWEQVANQWCEFI